MKTILAVILLFLAPTISLGFVQGATPYANGALTNTLVVAKASPALLCNYNISNTNTGTVFIQLFDAATTSGITLGVTAPKFIISVPSGNGVTDGLFLPGLAFQNGVVMAVTTTPTGSTAPSSAVSISLSTN
jgi:hypothetical protein